ncbi:putative lipid II flippase FtsW [Amycolatopsis australiensis]|uniref:Probable peptidoglycan glycosyltransferase FtsW n=1 Tax=Amycolatopsis australiensis TaxID=546364 RepID=A0A1K1SPK0_9PSEU|nr:putative lipid II flippase FtsW [Amycolatopsis australiensis]SFW86156.1 cell division-specific peptidoglycan biosynthesis regulator FtsW [Amycolatopsis australiensis]
MSAVREGLVGWLTRPLASFHLVLALTGILVVMGLVMVLSASSVSSYDPRTGGGQYSLFFKHITYVGLGAAVFWLALRMPIAKIRGLAGKAMALSAGLLVAVLTPLGSTGGGAQRWFVIAGQSVQPIELAKLALALWGAHVLVAKHHLLHKWRHLMVPVVPVTLVLFALVMAQPNLSGTITLGIVMLGLLWFAGIPARLFAALLVGAAAGFTVLALSAGYRTARVLSFLSASSDPSADAYQTTQALYALADGGFFGRGLGRGSANWGYLPGVQNDFIFALIGEELGFVGCVFVIALYAGVAIAGMRIARRNLDPWIRIVAGTLTLLVVAQAAINIGYVVGLLPVTGVTLPLVSYGGSSILATMALFGILANCARNEPQAVAALRHHGPGKFGVLLRLPAPVPYAPRRRHLNRTSVGLKAVALVKDR